MASGEAAGEGAGKVLRAVTGSGQVSGSPMDFVVHRNEFRKLGGFAGHAEGLGTCQADRQITGGSIGAGEVGDEGPNEGLAAFFARATGRAIWPGHDAPPPRA